MLGDLRRFLIGRGEPVSLQELAAHFDREESAIAGMLSHWQRKGMVEHIEVGCAQACGGCDRGQSGDYYRWILSAQPVRLIPLVCSERE